MRRCPTVGRGTRSSTTKLLCLRIGVDFLGPPQVILHEVEIRVEDVNERRVEHSAIGARLWHDQPHEEPTVDERLVGAQFFGTHAPERRRVGNEAVGQNIWSAGGTPGASTL